MIIIIAGQWSSSSFQSTEVSKRMMMRRRGNDDNNRYNSGDYDNNDNHEVDLEYWVVMSMDHDDRVTTLPTDSFASEQSELVHVPPCVLFSLS